MRLHPQILLLWMLSLTVLRKVHTVKYVTAPSGFAFPKMRDDHYIRPVEMIDLNPNPVNALSAYVVPQNYASGQRVPAPAYPPNGGAPNIGSNGVSNQPSYAVPDSNGAPNLPSSIVGNVGSNGQPFSQDRGGYVIPPNGDGSGNSDSQQIGGAGFPAGLIGGEGMALPNAKPSSNARGMNYVKFKQMMEKQSGIASPTVLPTLHTREAPIEGAAVQQTYAPGHATKLPFGHVVAKPSDQRNAINQLHQQENAQLNEAQKAAASGRVYAQLGGSQFYQSLFTGKGGFSPLSYFLGQGGAGGGGAGSAPFFVPVPIVVPPPPPPPPGPQCYTNPSGFLCCNTTLERTMEEAFADFKGMGISNCNVQKMAGIVQEAAEKKFGTPFESIAAHKDFVAKINFAGDLNCKIEVDGKFILAYATPLPEKEVNIIDANSFFSGEGEELEGGNGTDPSKPTYIVYGPIR